MNQFRFAKVIIQGIYSRYKKTPTVESHIPQYLKCSQTQTLNQLQEPNSRVTCAIQLNNLSSPRTVACRHRQTSARISIIVFNEDMRSLRAPRHAFQIHFTLFKGANLISSVCRRLNDFYARYFSRRAELTRVILFLVWLLVVLSSFIDIHVCTII